MKVMTTRTHRFSLSPNCYKRPNMYVPYTKKQDQVYYLLECFKDSHCRAIQINMFSLFR